jgi:uncharacterized protein YijF (DUF1287 family)
VSDGVTKRTKAKKDDRTQRTALPVQRRDARRRPGSRTPAASLPPYGYADAMREKNRRAQAAVQHLQAKLQKAATPKFKLTSVPAVTRQLSLSAAIRAPDIRSRRSSPSRPTRGALRFTRQQAAVIALLLLPAVLLTAVLAMLPEVGKGMQQTQLPLQSPQSRMAALERQMPRLAMPRFAPDVPRPPGDIRLAALEFPTKAPVIPGEIRHDPMAMPHTAPTVPPIVPGEIRVGALALPTSPPLAPAPLAEPAARIIVGVPAAKPAPVIALAPPAAELCVATNGKDGRSPQSLAGPTTSTHVDETALSFGERLAEAAVAQTREIVVYNAQYVRIAYPMGDVAPLFGVCSDVIVRAYRAVGIDLQELVVRTRTGTGDANIDHRRTEILRKFFALHGTQLRPSSFAEDYLPGDVVTYYRPQNRSSTAHIGIVTSVIAPSGRPMISHNRGWGPQLEDALFVDQMTGHYRFEGLKPEAIAKLAPDKKPVSVLALTSSRSNLAAVTLKATPEPQAAGALPLTGVLARICRNLQLPSSAALRANQSIVAQCKARAATGPLGTNSKTADRLDRPPVSAE